MTITREQVADLQPGDVVQVAHPKRADTFTQGPITTDNHGCLLVGNNILRSSEEWASVVRPELITVVSHAPRPLYVNHPRTEPVPGDIVNFKSRYSGDVVGPFLYTHVERCAGTREEGRSTRWVGLPGCHPDTGPIYNAGRLRLLVDGETGQVVQ